MWPPFLIPFIVGPVRRVLLVTMLIMAVAGCHSVLRSDLTVQPNSRFTLGGNQQGAFTVQASNKGQIPVTLLEKQSDGQLIALGTFSPGDVRTIRFAGGSAVFIDNLSTKPARLDLTVTGDKDLSMKTVQKP